HSTVLATPPMAGATAARAGARRAVARGSLPGTSPPEWLPTASGSPCRMNTMSMSLLPPGPGSQHLADIFVPVRGLVALIVGLGRTHLLRNCAALMVGPGHGRLYGVLRAWAMFVF